MYLIFWCLLLSTISYFRYTIIHLSVCLWIIFWQSRIEWLFVRMRALWTAVRHFAAVSVSVYYEGSFSFLNIPKFSASQSFYLLYSKSYCALMFSDKNGFIFQGIHRTDRSQCGQEPYPHPWCPLQVNHHVLIMATISILFVFLLQ